MAKRTEKQQLGVVAGVTALLTGLGGGGVWWAKGLVQDKQDTVAGMRAEIDRAVEKIRNGPKVELDVIALREDLYEQVHFLPDEEECNDFPRVLQRFAAQSRVVLQQLEVHGEPAGEGSCFERFTYRLQLDATLWQFLEFMGLLDGYERFVKVVEFSLQPGAGLAGAIGPDVGHEITMTVETYRRDAKKPDVAIPDYARKVIKYREGLPPICICGFPSRVYRFLGKRGRRDIFVDPRGR